MARRTPRPKRAKQSARKWFSAVLFGQRVLEPKRGCHRVVVTLGEDITETMVRDPHAVLVANIGDHLIVCGATIDETCGAEILRIEQNGYRERLHVQLVGSAVRNGAVQLLKIRKVAA